MLVTSIEKTIQAACEKRANIIMRCSGTWDVPKIARRYLSDDRMPISIRIWSDYGYQRSEDCVLGALQEGWKNGCTVIIEDAEHMTGISMYQLWQHLSEDEGCHPDFHVILVVGEDTPIEHYDRVFLNLFAVVNEDGTLYQMQEAP